MFSSNQSEHATKRAKPETPAPTLLELGVGLRRLPPSRNPRYPFNMALLVLYLGYRRGLFGVKVDPEP